jgi:hypothetical protein
VGIYTGGLDSGFGQWVWTVGLDSGFGQGICTGGRHGGKPRGHAFSSAPTQAGGIWNTLENCFGTEFILI